MLRVWNQQPIARVILIAFIMTFCPRVLRLDLLRARLIHLLDHLERKHDIADFARLAVPNQLDFALVLKEKKAVLVGGLSASR